MAFSLQGVLNWSVEWCAKDHVQYWMKAPQRNMVTLDGITYFDCSSFVFFAMWLGGGFNVKTYGYSNVLTDYTQVWENENGVLVNKANAWTVTPMEACLKKAGWVKILPGDEISPKPGDIMVKTKQHTEICYSTTPFKTMGARNPSLSPPEQVAIHTSNLSYWDCWYHLPEPEPPDPPEPPPTPPEPPAPVPPYPPGKKMNIMLMLKPYWKYGFK